MTRLFTGTCLALVAASIAVVAFGIGVLIGWLSTGQDAPDYYQEYTMNNKPLDIYGEAMFGAANNEDETNKREREWNKRESERDLSDERIVYNYVRRRFDVNQLRSQIGMIAERPRLAGSEHDTRIARLIEKKFSDSGMDLVRMLPYRVLLSRPSLDIPNRVYLLDTQDGDRILLETSHRESAAELDPEHNVPPAFAAYTPAADVTSTYVYVNYGRLTDFEALTQLGVDVAGKTAIMRYGKIFAGEKVILAQNRGAVGAVLYADPAEVAYFGTLPGFVYPNTAWLPGDAIRRSSTNLGIGDPATPTWASTEYAYHQWANQSVSITIPVQPIKYSDAVQLMSVLESPPVPNATWTGSLPGVPVYRVGPNERYKIRILTNNQLVEATCYNVIGYMYGKYEPHRYVILGSHRDSFTRGVADSASGTAVMLELSRLLTSARREQNWQPRRTIIFASWAAHDYGAIGATEFAQQFLGELRHRSVAYINSDMCAAGCRPQLRTSPLLNSLVRSVLQRIDDPSHPRRSLFERMMFPHDTLANGYASGGGAGGGIFGTGTMNVGAGGFGGGGAAGGGGAVDGGFNFNASTSGGVRGGGYGGGGFSADGGMRTASGGARDGFFDPIDGGGRPRAGVPPGGEDFNVLYGAGGYTPQQELRPSYTTGTTLRGGVSGGGAGGGFGGGAAGGTNERDFYRRGGVGGSGGGSSVYSRVSYAASHRLELNYPNGGGDYAPFLYYLGIPSVDVQFRYEPDLNARRQQQPPPLYGTPGTPGATAGGTGGVVSGSSGIDEPRRRFGSADGEGVDRANPYPALNTAYQTGRMVEQLDPGLHCHVACAKVSADLVVALTDALVLPFNVTEFALTLRRMWDELSEQRQAELLEFGGAMYTGRLRSRIDDFIDASIEFQNSIARLYKNRKGFTLNPFIVRRINDQMMLIERIFTMESGVSPGTPSQQLYRHMLASPSSIDNSRGIGFAGIRDRLMLLRSITISDEVRVETRRALEIHFSQLITAVEAAIQVLILHPRENGEDRLFGP